MIAVFQRQFHRLINDLISIESNSKDFEIYQSVLSTIYSLIEDNKLNETDTILRIHFPQYYNSSVPLIQSEN